MNEAAALLIAGAKVMLAQEVPAMKVANMVEDLTAVLIMTIRESILVTAVSEIMAREESMKDTVE